MRIALYQNLPSGGAKRAVYEWVSRLAKVHHLEAFTLSIADHDFCDIRPFVASYHNLDYEPHRLFRSPLGRLNQLQRWRDLDTLTQLGRRIAQNIDKKGFDVVFANPCLGTLIPLFLNFVQTPAVYYLHEPFGQQMTHQLQYPELKLNTWRERMNNYDPLIPLYYHRLNDLRLDSLRHSTSILANSQFTQQQVQCNHNINAQVCYYGVNNQSFYPLPDTPKENSVISVGELTPRKGFEFLINSLALIPDTQRPCLKLACNMEDPNHRRFIENLANQHQVNLQILTQLNTDQLRLEYNRARLCVYSPVAEPFGLVPLEAMACGLPVVGVAEGGVRESVIDGLNGFLVERDAAKFAVAVTTLLTVPALCTQYGYQARQYVLEKWTWDRSTTQLEQFLVNASIGKKYIGREM